MRWATSCCARRRSACAVRARIGHRGAFRRRRVRRAAANHRPLPMRPPSPKIRAAPRRPLPVGRPVGRRCTSSIGIAGCIPHHGADELAQPRFDACRTPRPCTPPRTAVAREPRSGGGRRFSSRWPPEVPPGRTRLQYALGTVAYSPSVSPGYRETVALTRPGVVACRRRRATGWACEQGWHGHGPVQKRRFRSDEANFCAVALAMPLAPPRRLGGR